MGSCTRVQLAHLDAGFIAPTPPREGKSTETKLLAVENGPIWNFIFFWPALSGGMEHMNFFCPVFTRPFFLLAPFAGHPSSSPFLGSFRMDLSTNFGRKFLPEVRAKKGSFLWVRTASGLFVENKWFPLKVGLRWVFVFCLSPEMGPKVGKSGFLFVQNWVNMRQNPTFQPVWTHFGTLTKKHKPT